MLLLVNILFFQLGWLARVFDGGQSVPYLASILIILSSCLGSMPRVRLSVFNAYGYLLALALITAFGVGSWVVSLKLRDVSIVDSLWSLMFVLAAVTYLLTATEVGPRASLILILVSIWAFRLSAYITWRNWG